MLKSKPIDIVETCRSDNTRLKFNKQTAQEVRKLKDELCCRIQAAVTGRASTPPPPPLKKNHCYRSQEFGMS